MIGAHIGTDDFFSLGQAAADVAVEEQKLIAFPLPDLSHLFDHVDLDLGELRSKGRVLVPHLLPYALHVPDLFVLLLHQQLMQFLVEVTDAVDYLWKFLLGPAQVVVAVIDQSVNQCNLTLDEAHAPVLLLLQVSAGSVQGHDLVLLVDVVLVHAGHAERLPIANAVKSSDVVVLQTPLQAFRVEDGSLQLYWSLDLLPKALDEGA